MSKDILVYADWLGIENPKLVGLLQADVVRNNEVFNFTYHPDWLTSDQALQIDPQLRLFSGPQFSNDSRNFRAFLDSSPDRWGRLLMQRREAVLANREKRQPLRLNESDYLLGVHDQLRMGGLRFKLATKDAFLDDNNTLSAPPISSLRELEYAVAQVEANTDIADPDYLKWLFMLISPGSSLGGARPKACVSDGEQLWLAKFPSRFDDYDIALWEYLTYLLAVEAGVVMAECVVKRFNSIHHTFLTRRFDRLSRHSKIERLHFSSAMTQLGYYDGEDGASYLELAQFIISNSIKVEEDLAQLWRRVVFNIAVSNTDDHLRNHGFLLHSLEDEKASGWRLSPAYDINPVPGATGLHLNISELDNRLDFELALEVAPYFQLNLEQANNILQEVQLAVSQWQKVAEKLSIPRNEQQMMAQAFNY